MARTTKQPNPRLLEAKLNRALDRLEATDYPQFHCSALDRLWEDTQRVLCAAVDAKLKKVAVRALNLIDTFTGEDPAGTWQDAVEHVEELKAELGDDFEGLTAWRQ